MTVDPGTLAARPTADIVADLNLPSTVRFCSASIAVQQYRKDAADRLAELDRWLPRVMSAAANYDTRIGVYGSSDLPDWLLDLIPVDDRASMEDRPSQSPRQILAPLYALWSETNLGDGFTHTIVLDCGCRVRLNFADRECDWKPGYWIACTRGHSATADYDQRTGEPNPERDRKVVEVIADPGTRPFDQWVAGLVALWTEVHAPRPLGCSKQPDWDVFPWEAGVDAALDHLRRIGGAR